MALLMTSGTSPLEDQIDEEEEVLVDYDHVVDWLIPPAPFSIRRMAAGGYLAMAAVHALAVRQRMSYVWSCLLSCRSISCLQPDPSHLPLTFLSPSSHLPLVLL
jgi:hypothetical protein